MRNKRVTVLTILMSAIYITSSFAHHPSNAADTSASLRVNGLTLAGCNNGNFEGSYGITVFDSDGTILNGTTGYSVSAVFSNGNDAYNTISFPHLNNVAYSYSIKLDGTADTGFVYFYLTDYPSVVSSTYVLDCTTSTAYVVREGDDRLNAGYGDLVDALYARVGADGQWEIHIYSIDENSTGTLAGKFIYEDFAPYLDNPPAQNTRIGQVSHSTLYSLTTGEFQIDIVSPTEPKTYLIIFSGMPPRNIYTKVNEP